MDHPIPKTRPNIDEQKRTYHLEDFAVSAVLRVKNERKRKVREQEKVWNMKVTVIL